MCAQIRDMVEDRSHRRIARLSNRFAGAGNGSWDRLLHADQHLVHAGEPVHRPWLVVAGVLKSYLMHPDGEEQVLEFHMAGDIIGLDALADHRAPCSVVAIDTCNVRSLSIRAPEPSAAQGRSTGDAEVIINGMYQEILRLTRRLHMANGSTDQRLASYLLEFSDGQRRRGCRPYEFHLPMRRRDLARYLGLATETLSRTFSRLRDRRFINVDNYEIEILDPNGLADVAGRGQQIAPDKAANS